METMQVTRLDPTEVAAVERQRRIVEAFARTGSADKAPVEADCHCPECIRCSIPATEIVILTDTGIGMPDCEMAVCHVCAAGDHR
jgi:hypothetical protein